MYTRNEILIIKHLIKHGSVHYSVFSKKMTEKVFFDAITHLESLSLIRSITEPKAFPTGFNTTIETDSYCIKNEDQCRHALKMQSKDRFRFVIPLVISTVSLIGAYRKEISLLIQALMRLLK